MYRMVVVNDEQPAVSSRQLTTCSGLQADSKIAMRVLKGTWSQVEKT